MYKIAVSICNTTTPELKRSVENIDKENGKPVVVLVPNNRATDKWISKVNTWCALNGKKYLIVKDLGDIFTKTIKDSFHLIDARKLKIAKQQDKTRAVIYQDARNWKIMTALEFHNYLRKCNDLSEAKDEAQAKRQNAELAKTGKDIKVLTDFILNARKLTYSYSDSSFHVAAKALLKDLKDIGIAANSPISIRKNAIKQEQIEGGLMKNYASNIQRANWVSDRTKRIVKEYPSKSKRLVDFLRSIQSEDSLRGNILKEFVTLDHSFRRNRDVSKSDMTKILNLV